MAKKSQARQLIFISHDTRDKSLADAFAHLIQDVTAGLIHTFRSSDITGVEGISYREDWYTTIRKNIDICSDIVCLLTPRSYERPWILFEAGMGKSRGDIVSGLVIGMKKSEVKGPFSQLQLCASELDSLTYLIIEIIRRNTEANPNIEAIRSRVKVFIEEINQVYVAEHFSSNNSIYYEEIHHISIPVKNLDKSLSFYKEILGLKEIRRETFPFKGAWFGFPNGQHLHLVLKPEATYRQARVIIPADKIIDVHFALRVDDKNWKRILGVVKENGLLDNKIADIQPFVEFNDLLQLYILDPDNHVIEITSLTDKQREIEYLKTS